MKRHFFFKEKFQIMCLQRLKTHSKYIIDVLLHYNIVFQKIKILGFHRHHEHMGFHAF
jgi:hypothetical protein